MSKSAIEWTEQTWNPIVGCSLKSPGCTNCYAMGEAARQIRCAAGLKRQTHYAGTVKTVNGKPVWTGKLARAPESVLLAPLKRKKPTTYFVNSMGDLFHEDCPDEWIDPVFAVMALCPQHTFQVLTKRAARMREYCADPGTEVRIWNAAVALDCKVHLPEWHPSYNLLFAPEFLQLPLPNLWLGVSTERQPEADELIPDLLRTPAAMRFISYEPALGPIDLTDIVTKDGLAEVHRSALECDVAIEDDDEWRGAVLDWVIVGGESGPGARPMHVGWARDLRDQCAAAGVSFFFKQHGEWHPRGERPGIAAHCIAIDGTISRGDELKGGPDERPRWIAIERVGKKAAGRLLDGVEHNDMPGRAT